MQLCLLHGCAHTCSHMCYIISYLSWIRAIHRVWATFHLQLRVLTKNRGVPGRKKHPHKYISCCLLLWLLPQEPQERTRTLLVFTLPLQTAKKRRFLPKTSTPRGDKRRPGAPRLVPSVTCVTRPAPGTASPPGWICPHCPCCNLKPAPIVTKTQILRGKKQINKFDIPGPAIPGASQNWDGETHSPSGVILQPKKP